jgi:hypothetical protein
MYSPDDLKIKIAQAHTEMKSAAALTGSALFGFFMMVFV